MMSALGFERYGVVGHSLGGAIALHLAARDQRVLWCVAGGVGTEVWDAGPRQELAEMLRTGHARTESDEGLLDFLISRRHDLVRLATLCEGELSPTPDLARLASRVTVVATPDDRAQADALTQRASLAPALSLPGDHVSSWLSGEFLRLALDQHLPRSTSGSRSPGGPRPKMLLISGLPGSGKTTVASFVAERHGMELISRTAVRHDLASRPVYSLEEAKEVTVEIDRRANIAVEQGDSLVIEGTGLQPDVRDRLRTYATRARTAGFIAAAVWLEGERAIVRERLEARPLTKRLEGDMSEADVGIYDVMRSRARPGWLGNRCDVTDASAETVANWICDVLSGSVADLDAPAYFLSQAALAEAGAIASRSSTLPRSSWISEVLSHIRADAEHAVFDRWADSTLIDENVARPVINERILQHLLSTAGLQGRLERTNAGLAHAYAYLFAHEPTPYGHKRDRWLDGRLQRILGVERGRLAPVPRVGTLLSNVTAALDAHLLGDKVEWVDTSTAGYSCLDELDQETGTATKTWVIQREGHLGGAAIQVLELPGASPRYLTVFPVDAAFSPKLLVESQALGPLRGRFNAVLPPTSNEPAQRAWLYDASARAGLRTISGGESP